MVSEIKLEFQVVFVRELQTLAQYDFGDAVSLEWIFHFRRLEIWIK
jgi:hypothetical protein